MLTALLATLVSNLVNRHSFYDQLKTKYIQEINWDEAQALLAREKQQEWGEGETSSSQPT